MLFVDKLVVFMIKCTSLLEIFTKLKENENFATSSHFTDKALN